LCFVLKNLITPPLKECSQLIVRYIVPLFPRELLLFMSASIGEQESSFVIFHSLSVFLLEWRELCLIIFIAALSSSIVIEESALGVSQPLFCSVQENLQWLCTNKPPCSETPCICVLCSSGPCQRVCVFVCFVSVYILYRILFFRYHFFINHSSVQ